jgi:creatinine amidohydrolase
MVVLGVVERADGRYLSGDRAEAGATQGLFVGGVGLLGGPALLVVRVVDRRAVLRADVVALDVLMTKLRFQRGIHAAYLFYFTIVDDLMREGAKTERWGHACEVETSMGLALQPDIVHGEMLEAGTIRSASLPYSNVMESPRVGVPLAFEEITENGALGDARQASEEFGQELTNAVVTRSVEFLERFIGE